jgi:hypothetical protein
VGKDMKRSPGQWAPWLANPESAGDSLMTPEALKRAADGVANLMAERQEQLGQRILYNVLRNNPSLTREQAQAKLDQFL